MIGAGSMVVFADPVLGEPAWKTERRAAWIASAGPGPYRVRNIASVPASTVIVDGFVYPMSTGWFILAPPR